MLLYRETKRDGEESEQLIKFFDSSAAKEKSKTKCIFHY